MKSMLKIRPAVMEDSAVIVDFNARIAWETEHKKLDLAILTPGVLAVLQNQATKEKGFYTVVENAAGEVVGQCMMTFEWSDWRNGWFWWIQSVYVREDSRGQGVWSMLYRHMEAEAKKLGNVVGLRLYVERENKKAQAAYQKLGMSELDYNIMEAMIENN